MTPDASASDNYASSGDGPQDSTETEEKRKLEDCAMGPEEGPSIGLCRQLCLCAGLMASDGGLVFVQLAMVPCLQTLGVPVPLVTVAGVISSSLALMGLPLQGWISDGGTHPHRRKKPAVVIFALVFVAGYSLVISGCALRLRTANHHSVDTYPNSSTNLNMRTHVNYSTLPKSGHHSSTVPVSFLPSGGNSTYSNTSIPVLRTGRPEDNSSELSDPSSGTLESPTKNSSDLPESGESTSDPLGLGIPLTGLLGILGFVFVDMGNDFNNSCLKSFVLSCTAKRQHDSLFVVGVLMSAVGGCVAAVLGVLDVAALLIEGADLEAVPTKTLLQSAFFLVLTMVCMLVTLLSAPPFLPSTSAKSAEPTSSENSPSESSEHGGENGDTRKLNAASGQHSSSVQSVVGSIVADNEEVDRTHEVVTGDQARVPPSDLVCGSSLTNNENCLSALSDAENTLSLTGSRVQVEKEPFLKPSDRTLPVGSLSSSFSDAENSAMNKVVQVRRPSSRSVDFAVTDENDSLHNHQDTADCAHEKRADRTSLLQAPDYSQHLESLKCGKLSIRKSTLRMVPVCTSMFFMAGAWQSFNICATDNLGKVVYGGDPDADRHSQSYVAYQQGIRTGSVGVLLLNVAYVAVNLLQKKILALIGPKAEYLSVCALQVAVLTSLQLTDEVMLFFTTAVVYGLFRSVMNTVPFMLANTICQQAVSTQTGTGSARVGSTMALMTAMMPLSYVLVSTLTGPLIHITGDPAAPLYYAIVTTALAALVFAFT